jgi:hypothetical protein
MRNHHNDKKQCEIIQKHVPTLAERVWKSKFKTTGFCPCPVCGIPMHPLAFEVGHIKSAADGGKLTPENCWPICPFCNRSMGRTNYMLFLRSLFERKYAFLQCPKALVRLAWFRAFGLKDHGTCAHCGRNLSPFSFRCIRKNEKYGWYLDNVVFICAK